LLALLTLLQALKGKPLFGGKGNTEVGVDVWSSLYFYWR
jgi:hypothetical protein